MSFICATYPSQASAATRAPGTLRSPERISLTQPVVFGYRLNYTPVPTA